MLNAVSVGSLQEILDFLGIPYGLTNEILVFASCKSHSKTRCAATANRNTDKEKITSRGLDVWNYYCVVIPTRNESPSIEDEAASKFAVVILNLHTQATQNQCKISAKSVQK